jgi:hypothetical protein
MKKPGNVNMLLIQIAAAIIVIVNILIDHFRLGAAINLSKLPA